METVMNRPVELVVVDNKFDKVEAANAVNRLIERDKVSALIGTYGSSPAMAGAEAGRARKITVREAAIIKHNVKAVYPLLSPREAARLMGAPETFKLPGTFNDGYKAMGDAVAAPVAAYLAQHLLSHLAAACDDLS